MVRLSLMLSIVLLAFQSVAIAQDKDSDKDGLSDFHERHKYLTDPKKADTDGDGIPDGDWAERREYQYTIRQVAHVMRPVTIEFLCDDYQDARILDETKDYVELEVILYPFNGVADALEGDKRWRTNARKLKEWLRPGPSSDWTPAMRRELTASLAKAGIDVSRLDDRELVEKASKWLVNHAKHHDGFSSFITAFDDEGRPFVPEELSEKAKNGLRESGMSLADQFEREISAAGMFKHARRGSCTSSAIYMSGSLRALGIPTRTVLCIPLADATDERELELVRLGISHNGLRSMLLGKLEGMRNSWSSHTFNEVWVGGRWRRLNYDRLGQNIMDPGFFGMMTHIATFFDWADAKMPETVGRRQALKHRDDVFGGANPYSTISVRDQFGVHCERKNSPRELSEVTVRRVEWTDSQRLPQDVRDNCERRGRFGLIAYVHGIDSVDKLRSFMADADNRVFLVAEGHPRLGVGFDPGCWWFRSEEQMAQVYVPFGGGDRRDLQSGVAYSFQPRNQHEDLKWRVPEEITVLRK